MTVAETKVVLEKGTVEARVVDVVEALNLERAMKKYEKLDKLSLDIVFDIHKIITNLVVDEEEWSGALRDATVYGKRKEFIRFSLKYTLFMCMNGLEFVKEIR